MKQKKRSEIAVKDTWDLTVIYKDREEFLTEYKKFASEMKKIEQYKGKLLTNAKTLLEFLKLSDELERTLYKLYYYAQLNFDADTTNSKSQELTGMVSKLMTEFSEIISFVDPELLKGDYKQILDFIEEEPKLLEYKFVLSNLYRYKEHTLSEKEERLLSTLGEALSSSEETYEALTDSDLKFGNITIDGKRVEFTESNYTVYRESSNPKIRKQAFNILLKTYGKFSHTIANTFRFNIETNAQVAKLKKYNSSIEASLYHDNISLEIYDNLIKGVRKHLDALYDYYDLKREVLGVSKLHIYDVYANMVADVDKSYTFEEAKKIVIEALKVLGDDYNQKLQQAFSNRYIDIYNNIGKRGGAYSSGFYDTNPYILLNFEGKYNDVTTLAHELGHSMHTLYSCESNPYSTSQYKIFVAEVASTVNELLLVKYLLKKTSKKEEKLFLLDKLLELFKGTIYRQTMFAEFEKKMYEDHEKGIVLTSEYISSEYYKLNKDYFGKKVVVDKLIQNEWMRIPHFYYNFYVYKYAIGLCSACKIVHDIETKGDLARDKYLDFLRTGGSKYPSEELLVAGVDITAPNFIDDAIELFKETIKEFREIYRK